MRAAELSGSDQQELAKRFVGVSAGDATVIDAWAETRYDAAEPYVLVSLELGPPPRTRDTWTTDDMFALRQEVRRRLSDTGASDVEVSYVGGASAGDPVEATLPSGKASPPPTSTS